MRGLAFVVVGAGGFVLQLGTLFVLTAIGGWPYLPATAAAVEAAVLHNFWWHERWTWRDRTGTIASQCQMPNAQCQRRSKADAECRRRRLQSRMLRLVRYHATMALTSIVGNVLITTALVEVAGLPVIAANAAGVCGMAAANFLVSDRWVFARVTALALALVAALPPAAAAAGPEPETIAAWRAFVTRAETELHACACDPNVPQGSAIDVPGGAIHRWRGSVMVPGATLDEVLDALKHPGTPPPQEEVLEARVLSRSGDALKVYLKLRRRAIVTVTYDTEHEVSFTRHSPRLASSRSVATRIAEVDRRDRGFLWRLNSYWRYTQQEDGVRIDVESLSLSRRVPAVLKLAASPIIHRLGRESMLRTLDALRRFLEVRATDSRPIHPRHLAPPGSGARPVTKQRDLDVIGPSVSRALPTASTPPGRQERASPVGTSPAPSGTRRPAGSSR